MSEFSQNSRNYERMLDPEPAFLTERVAVLETGAASGELAGKELRFSAGIETEFGLYNPTKFRNGIDSSHPDVIVKHPSSQQHEIDAILQTEEIATLEPRTLTEQETEERRAEVRSFIGNLAPKSPSEAAQQKKWLADVDNFGINEFINFQLYKEFSTPTLSPPIIPKGATYEELEEASNALGWIEFRFGTGKYQSGYYDNDSTSEIRLAPCPPSESVRRHAIIMQRLGEISSEYGVLASIAGSHINLGVYGRDEKGSLSPLIGNETNRRTDTLDITAGVAAAFQDKVWLSQDQMRNGFMNDKYYAPNISFGPGRGGVRLQEDYLELRQQGSFQSIAHGLGWLMAGTIVGEAAGATGLKESGYQTTEVSQAYHVTRTDEFDKLHDLHVQRAFEKVHQEDGVFKLDLGFNIIKGHEIAQSLLGEVGPRTAIDAFDLFNDLIIGATSLQADGMLVCDGRRLREAISESKAIYKDKMLDTWFNAGFNGTLEKVNSQFKKIRVEPVQVIQGKIEAENMDPESTTKRLANSPIARLEFGDKLDEYMQWIHARANTLYLPQA